MQGVVTWCLLVRLLFAPANSGKMAHLMASGTSFVICWTVDTGPFMLYSSASLTYLWSSLLSWCVWVLKCHNNFGFLIPRNYLKLILLGSFFAPTLRDGDSQCEARLLQQVFYCVPVKQAFDDLISDVLLQAIIGTKPARFG